MTAIDTFTADLKNWVETGELPGVQYTLAENGATLSAGNLGYADLEQQIAVTEDTLFRLASASKLFVSVALLKLLEQSTLNLNTPLQEIFPEYRNLKVLHDDGSTRPAQNPIRLLDLLRHSCGYGYGDAARLNGVYRQALLDHKMLGIDELGYDHWRTPLSLRDWARQLADIPMEDEPGTRVCYGLGHDLAGAVIEEVAGQSLAQYFETEVCKPMDLRNTFFVVPEDRQNDLTAFYIQSDSTSRLVEPAAMSEFLKQPLAYSGGGGWDMLGNGGLVSNATDFSTLLQMIVGNGLHCGDPFLSAGEARLLCQSHTTDLDFKHMLAGCEYSMGVAVVTNSDLYREQGTGSDGPKGKLWWGGSTNTYFFYVPATGRVGVMLSNTFPFGHKGALFKFGRLSK